MKAIAKFLYHMYDNSIEIYSYKKYFINQYLNHYWFKSGHKEGHPAIKYMVQKLPNFGMKV